MCVGDAVDGTGVLVGGTSVRVDVDEGVAEGGTGVFVDVMVGGSGVLVAV